MRLFKSAISVCVIVGLSAPFDASGGEPDAPLSPLHFERAVGRDRPGQHITAMEVLPGGTKLLFAEIYSAEGEAALFFLDDFSNYDIPMPLPAPARMIAISPDERWATLVLDHAGDAVFSAIPGRRTNALLTIDLKKWKQHAIKSIAWTISGIAYITEGEFMMFTREARGQRLSPDFQERPHDFVDGKEILAAGISGGHLGVAMKRFSRADQVEFTAYNPLNMLRDRSYGHVSETDAGPIERLAISADGAWIVFLRNGALQSRAISRGGGSAPLEGLPPENITAFTLCDEIGTIAIAGLVAAEPQPRSWLGLWDFPFGNKLDQIEVQGRVSHLDWSLRAGRDNPDGYSVLVATDNPETLVRYRLVPPAEPAAH